MSKLDALKKIIREELISVLREELPKLINENARLRTETSNSEHQSVPKTLNTVETYKKMFENKFTNSSPLNQLLNETARSMTSDDTDSFTTEDVNPTSFFQPKEARVSDVNGMLSSARPSSNLEAVTINEVPDYSQLMKKMINKGAI